MNRLLALILAAPTLLAQNPAPDFARALGLEKQLENTVFRANVAARWLPGGQRLWYRVQTGPASYEYVLVDAATGQIKRAADAASLGVPAVTLTTSKDTTTDVRNSARAGEESRIRFTNRTAEPVELVWIKREGLRKSFGKLAPGAARDLQTFAGHVWLITDAHGETLGVIEAKAEPIDLAIDGKGRTPSAKKQRDTSPDGRWTVRFEKNQIVLHDTTSNEATTLTTDGTDARPYRGPVAWAPDGQSFTVLSVKAAPMRKVTIVESSPSDQLQPKVHTFDYMKPGDVLPIPRPVLVRLADRQPRLIDDALCPNPFTREGAGAIDIRWAPDSHEFFFDYNQRGHQLYRLLAVNAHTGAIRTVVEETARTFIDHAGKTWRHWLDDTRELLWMSERDGWSHLWLYDAATGAIKNQVTRGAWVVRKVERVDKVKRQVWFLASGLRAGEDPYHQHLCRVNFDGTDFLRLTHDDGEHEITLSPDARFFTARRSRADLPPVTELRRGEDGSLVCELERADTGALFATGWTLPERFVAKGRDGKTDIHGIIIQPSHFDPAKKYPVLEQVYAGPHGAFSPKKFGPLPRQHALAELGFIVVQADGMGTNHRGKVFHDVAWKNLQDAGFPDRIAWIKAAAGTRSWMDLSRVGIYGGSAGGQNAMRALLDHADFYRAAFADCGCHDNRMDKIWWNEQWLGWPVDDAYVRASNVADAARLRGALMLCVGEIDRNVDPASTMQVAHALEKAGKNFELVVITGAGHGAAETPYGQRRRMDFFARHLLGHPVGDLVQATAATPSAEPEKAERRPHLQIFNGTNEPADVFWLKSATERVPNGSVAPGKNAIITTTIGHRFAVIGRESKTETLVTSEVPVQAFRFGGVPAFYTQAISANGFPIVASAQVNPYALKEAAYLVDLMLAQRPDVRTALIKSGARLCIMAHREYTTDLPEFTWMAKAAHPEFPQLAAKDYRDARSRGTGGSLTDPYCTCAEENVLGFRGDPYEKECILIHELAHCIHLRGMTNVDPTFDGRLEAAYDAAMKAGRWKGKYASVNHHEYFAEGVQSWFDDNREDDHDHNHVNTRAELLAYDPGLAALCREVFGDTEIKYTKPATRLREHMAGYDPANAPTFAWPERLLKAKAEIKKHAEARHERAQNERETREISGWTVHIHQALFTTDRAATERALELVKAQLETIVRVVPARAVAELKKVPIYLSPEYPGERPRAEYHPNAGWLRAHGRDVVMEKAVEITSVFTFDASVRRMPMVMLHELAHAYHDRVLGFEQPDIMAAFERAKAGKGYDAVERRHGDGRANTTAPAYAMTNHKEYFAEASEAFFGENDFFPFNHTELAQHDPEMTKVLARLWGVEQ